MAARVVKTFKKISKHKHYRHLLLENGDIVEADFQNHIESWEEVPDISLESNHEEVFHLNEILGKENDIINESYSAKVLPKSEYGKK